MRTRQRDSRLEYYNIQYSAANVGRHRRLVRHWALRRTAEVVFVVSCDCGRVGGEEEELRDDDDGYCATTRNRTYRGNHRDQPAGCGCCCCCRSPSPRPEIPLSLRRRRRWPRTDGVYVPRSYRVRIFFISFWVFSYNSKNTPEYIMWNVLLKTIAIRK